VRLFFAYPINNEDKLYFSEQALKFNEYFFGNWVDKTNYHITVKFLGEVKDSTMNGILDNFEFVAKDLKKFSFKVDRYGFFGKPKPKVLWFGSSFMDASILSNFKVIQEFMEEFGFKKEGLYIPHITICRIKEVKDRNYNNVDFNPITLNINKIVLYKSVLAPNGSKYFELKNWQI
jgi:2'-5' RNA ligase